MAFGKFPPSPLNHLVDLLYRILTLVAVAALLIESASGQAYLAADLYPIPPSQPPLFGQVHFEIPAANLVAQTEVLPEPIYFDVWVNGTVSFTTGRIEGPRTAWAFDLGSPIFSDGFTRYSGSTQMALFQIEDMLANSASFGLHDELLHSENLIGSIAQVPEPTTWAMVACGLFVGLLLYKRTSPPIYPGRKSI